eukprot:CAMPEP_0184552710 /NCGR_PEP_ID=MMETSP0199_2-20130426/29779_1 /TAXON_ID=1112570 /ORGANISM="Thraustochytrium sp., Strain LLF1b" /LENGTH=49 /DNA_ID=CAMNT_0026948267 /DNA_START=110 /DNA_END=259 /DNA_ORIENTATION=+
MTSCQQHLVSLKRLDDQFQYLLEASSEVELGYFASAVEKAAVSLARTKP